MKLIIHRSASEIGGNCIELQTEKSKILIDAGLPLDDDSDMLNPELKIPPTLNLNGKFDGLVISHSHIDHFGLLKAFGVTCPIYSGKDSEKLIKFNYEYKGDGKLPHDFINFSNRIPFEIGDFKITPYLTDHSAFDAYMFLIEAEGKRVFYSGDFRLNGRKAKLVKDLMLNPPDKIACLIVEGTNAGSDKQSKHEYVLERELADIFNATKGRIFIEISSQNIDRIVTILKACKRSDRLFIIDIYTAHILSLIRNNRNTIPQKEWPEIKVVITRGEKIKYKRIGREDFISEVIEVDGKGISAKRFNQGWLKNTVINTRPYLFRDYCSAGLKLSTDDILIWSLWSKYQEKEYNRKMLDYFKNANVDCVCKHCSGHASMNDISKFIKALHPATVIPIHTQSKESFKEYSGSEMLNLKNGDVVNI